MTTKRVFNEMQAAKNSGPRKQNRTEGNSARHAAASRRNPARSVPASKARNDRPAVASLDNALKSGSHDQGAQNPPERSQAKKQVSRQTGLTFKRTGRHAGKGGADLPSSSPREDEDAAEEPVEDTRPAEPEEEVAPVISRQTPALISRARRPGSNSKEQEQDNIDPNTPDPKNMPDTARRDNPPKQPGSTQRPSPKRSAEAEGAVPKFATRDTVNSGNRVTPGKAPAARPSGSSHKRGENIETEHRLNFEAGVERRMGKMESAVSDLQTMVASSVSELKNLLVQATSGPVAKLQVPEPGPTESGKGRSASSAVQSVTKSVDRSQSTNIDALTLMDSRVPYFNIAFSKETVRNSIAVRVFDLIRIKGQNDWVSLSGMWTVLQAAVFALDNSKGQTRKVFKEGVGKEASTLRRRILIQAMYHAQRDTFNVFLPRNDESKENSDIAKQEKRNDISKKGKVKVSRVKKDLVVKRECPSLPSWLVGGDKEPYIKTSDIDAARRYHEEVNGNVFSKRMTKISRGASPTRADDALHAMIKLYTYTSDIMQGTRRHFPSEFFLQVGYLFLDWSKYPDCKVSKDSLEMYWAIPRSEFVRPKFDDVEIPESVTRLENPESVDEENEELFTTFAEKRNELELIVSHDVWVRKNGRMTDQRNHPGDERRVFRRCVNLMDVAGFICRTISGFDHHEVSFFNILKFHKKSIACLYQFALVLRDLVQYMGDGLFTDAAVASDDEEENREEVDQKDDLTPTDSDLLRTAEGDASTGVPLSQEASSSHVVAREGQEEGADKSGTGNPNEVVAEAPDEDLADEDNENCPEQGNSSGGNLEDAATEDEETKKIFLDKFVALFLPNDTTRKRCMKRALLCVAEERYDLEHIPDVQQVVGEYEGTEEDGEDLVVAGDEEGENPDDFVLVFD